MALDVKQVNGTWRSFVQLLFLSPLSPYSWPSSLVLFCDRLQTRLLVCLRSSRSGGLHLLRFFVVYSQRVLSDQGNPVVVLSCENVVDLFRNVVWDSKQFSLLSTVCEYVGSVRQTMVVWEGVQFPVGERTRIGIEFLWYINFWIPLTWKENVIIISFFLAFCLPHNLTTLVSTFVFVRQTSINFLSESDLTWQSDTHTEGIPKEAHSPTQKFVWGSTRLKGKKRQKYQSNESELHETSILPQQESPLSSERNPACLDKTWFCLIWEKSFVHWSCKKEAENCRLQKRVVVSKRKVDERQKTNGQDIRVTRIALSQSKRKSCKQRCVRDSHQLATR